VSLNQQFADLASSTQRLISILQEADERYWLRTFRRALPLVEANKLAGATHILGCYGGMDTFSDLVVGEDLRDIEPLRFKNLNARLHEVRNELFVAANRITSRESW
jgi:hypothetical protein